MYRACAFVEVRLAVVPSQARTAWHQLYPENIMLACNSTVSLPINSCTYRTWKKLDGCCSFEREHPSFNSAPTKLNGDWQVGVPPTAVSFRILARAALGRISRYHFHSLCLVNHAIGLQYVIRL